MKPLAWGGLIYYIVETLFGDDEEAEQNSDSTASEEGSLTKDSEKDGAEGTDDTLFIPLGFAYQLPQTFYKGSDPEWQSFIQLSRNKKRCAFLKSMQPSTSSMSHGLRIDRRAYWLGRPVRRDYAAHGKSVGQGQHSQKALA